MFTTQSRFWIQNQKQPAEILKEFKEKGLDEMLIQESLSMTISDLTQE